MQMQLAYSVRATAKGRLVMSMCCVTSKRKIRLLGYLAGAFAATLPGIGEAATVGNPLCPGESVLFNPDNGQDIVVPSGFKVSVFASGLNFPTGIAFLQKGTQGAQDNRPNGQRGAFEVYVLESGHGLPSRCNDEAAWQTKGLGFNPFTPDILVFN